MYAKLILRNARRSVKDYLVYVITLTLCVAMFYAFLSITSSFYKPDIGVEFDLAIVNGGMKLAITAITLLLLFLIQYVNQYMLRRRMKEFALQTMMGMEQRTTACMFFAETLVMGLFALAAGIAAGAVLSQFITAMLLSSYGKEYVFSWTLFPDTVLLTVGFFVLCFALAGFFNVRTIRRTKIIDMLRADRENEENFRKSRWMPGIVLLYLLMLCVMVYTGVTKAYYYYDVRYAFVVKLMFLGNILAPALSILLMAVWWLKRKHRDFIRLCQILFPALFPVAFFAAMVPGCQSAYYLPLGDGTRNSYMMFLTGVMAFLICDVIYLANSVITGWKEKSAEHRYHEESLFFYGQIQSKLKTGTKTMMLISLTLAVSVSLFVMVPALVGWSMGFLKQRAVYDVQVFSSYSQVYEKEKLPSENYEEITEYLAECELRIVEDCLFSLYLPREEEFHNRYKYDFPVLAISLTDYNQLCRMRGEEEIALAENEFALQWQSIATGEVEEEFVREHQRVMTDAGELVLAEDGSYRALLGETLYNSYTDVIYIFPDRICGNLLAVNRNRYILTASPVAYDAAIKLEELFQKWYMTDREEKSARYYIRTRSEQMSSTTGSIFVMKASMTYAAVVLLVSCFTILSLQQLSQADQFGYRFGVLKKLGVDEERIDRLVVKQLVFWFGLPVLAAVVVSAIAMIYFFTSISAQIDAYIGAAALAEQVAAILSILVTLTVCYFAATWVLFRRSIRSSF
ncbi:MAG: FtsX-like permease family protein [Lachnospiraceae bacterium]|nr:FtsX-like permease family protein [Lachnospiraceae bacterium]